MELDGGLASERRSRPCTLDLKVAAGELYERGRSWCPEFKLSRIQSKHAVLKLDSLIGQIR